MTYPDTAARERFQLDLIRWASRNGYRRRQGIWRSEDHYLCPQRGMDGKWFVTKRAYGSGAVLSSFYLEGGELQ